MTVNSRFSLDKLVLLFIKGLASSLYQTSFKLNFVNNNIPKYLPHGSPRTPLRVSQCQHHSPSPLPPPPSAPSFPPPPPHPVAIYFPSQAKRRFFFPSWLTPFECFSGCSIVDCPNKSQ